MKNIIPAVLIVASIWLFFGYVSPSYDEIRVLQAKQVEFETAIQNTNEINKQREEILAEVSAFPGDEVARLNRIMPDSVDTVHMFMDISGIASRYAIPIKNIKASDMSAVPGAEQTANASEAYIPGKKYNVVTLTFSATAPYPQFVKFMKDLEKSLQVVDVTDISFHQASKGDLSLTSNTSGSHEYTVSMNTYWLK